jgi:hypothetical protein
MFNNGKLTFAYLWSKVELHVVAFVVFMACLFLLKHGYTFNGEDQAEHLPQVYQLHNPQLYPKDYFVSYVKTHFNVRFFYVYLVYFLSLLFPVWLICLLGTFVCLVTTFLIFFKITQLFTNSQFAPFLAVFFIFFIFHSFTIGGNHIGEILFVGTTPASTLAFLALFLAFKKEYFWAFILTGIATLFQLVVGVQAFLIISGLILFSKSHQLFSRQFIIYILSYFMIAGWILIPMLFKESATAHLSIIDKEVFFQALYAYRNHLHYLPSLFPVSDYLKLFTITFLALLCIRHDYKRWKAIITMALLIFIGMIIYTVLLESKWMESIGMLQWFKTTIWIEALSAMVLAIVIAEWLEHKFRLKIKISRQLIGIISLSGASLLCVIMLFADYLPMKKLHGKYDLPYHIPTDKERMHVWIKQHTPVEAVFLAAPDDDSFACEAQRSLIIGYKAIVHEPGFLINWYQVFSTIYGVNLVDIRKGNAIDLAVQNYNTRKFVGNMQTAIDYRLVNTLACQYRSASDSIVHREGEYVLIKE